MKNKLNNIIIVGISVAILCQFLYQKPEVRSTTVDCTQGTCTLWVEVNANRWNVDNRELFAETLLEMTHKNKFRKVQFSKDLAEPDHIIFRVYSTKYQSKWMFEIQCQRQKKDTHQWEVRVQENES